MKQWNLILALFLCLIAVGGLAVVFRSDKQPSSSGKSNNSTGGDSSYNENIDGIDLNETNLIF